MSKIDVDALLADINSVHITELVLSDFTSNVTISEDENGKVVNGDGWFDDMMETATKHLTAQFESNRIRQEDYAVAYVDIYKATLEAALKAWLQKPLLDLQVAELRAKLYQTLAQIELTIAQEKETEAKIREIEAQIPLITAQTAKVTAETDTEKEHKKLITAQTATENKKPANVEASTNKTTAEAAIIPKQGSKLDAESTLLGAQKSLVNAQTTVAEKQATLVQNQAATELKKAILHDKQATAFRDDYKQKILKIMLDGWGVGYATAKDAFSGSLPSPITSSSINSIFSSISKDIS